MIVLVHGGAGFRRPRTRLLKKLTESLFSGYRLLQRGGSSLDAVTESIRVLEDSGLFNAGSGANLQLDGVRRLDASLMEGRYLNAGSVIGSAIYADNTIGTVSCTGTGEFIIRLVLAKEICTNMKRPSPQKASALSLQRITSLGGQAGVIVLNRQGRFAITHTTEYMASGHATEKGITVREGFVRVSKD